MRKVYLLSNREPKKEQVEDLIRNFGDVEIIKPSIEIKNFWEKIDSGIGMTCSEFCKGISEIVEDIKLKKADIAWIEGDSFIRKMLYKELDTLNIGVIYSVKELEFEEIEKEDGTIVDRIKGVKHARFQAESC
jgi:predicted SpoU family rRNA methylase